MSASHRTRPADPADRTIQLREVCDEQSNKFWQRLIKHSVLGRRPRCSSELGRCMCGELAIFASDQIREIIIRQCQCILQISVHTALSLKHDAGLFYSQK